jgi:hypothetical protein
MDGKGGRKKKRKTGTTSNECEREQKKDAEKVWSLKVQYHSGLNHAGPTEHP